MKGQFQFCPPPRPRAACQGPGTLLLDKPALETHLPVWVQILENGTTPHPRNQGLQSPSLLRQSVLATETSEGKNHKPECTRHPCVSIICLSGVFLQQVGDLGEGETSEPHLLGRPGLTSLSS